MAENFVSTSTISRDNLVSGNFPLVTENGTVLAGQNLTRGTLLGKIELSGKVVKSLAAADDGSQHPYAILARDVDASLEDRGGEWYLAGQFNQEKVIFGTGHTVASTKAALRDLSIFLEAVSKE